MSNRDRLLPRAAATGQHARAATLTSPVLALRRLAGPGRGTPPPAPAIQAALQLTRTGLGAAYLLFPARAARLAAGREHGSAAAMVARILGARHLAQALATAGQPGAAVLALGAEADAAHAASMLALGLISSRWRRPALRDAVLAALLAAAGVTAARHAPAPARPSPRYLLAARLARHLVPRWLTRSGATAGS